MDFTLLVQHLEGRMEEPNLDTQHLKRICPDGSLLQKAEQRQKEFLLPVRMLPDGKIQPGASFQYG